MFVVRCEARAGRDLDDGDVVEALVRDQSFGAVEQALMRLPTPHLLCGSNPLEVGVLFHRTFIGR